MAKQPLILSIDDDPQVQRALQRDLRAQYREHYRILSTTSAAEALASLPELKKQGQTVALFLSDQRMPEMAGVDFLVEAKKIFPEAKRVLLTAYSDTEAAIKAINEAQLDYYLAKPWDPPTEKLYPVLDELLDDWRANHQPDYDGLRLIGFQVSSASHELKDFLSGNLFPYQWLSYPEQPAAHELLALHGLAEKDLPVVLLPDGQTMPKPSKIALAERLGLRQQASQPVYDVVIIGAGPAGLAAAVYGGSEGLKTLIVEKQAPGGQAGTSSRIENYLGFPTGLSGAELARRATAQAQRFGVEFLSPQQVVGIQLAGQYKLLTLANGSQVNTKALVISTGVDYRQLDTPGMRQLAGAGVYYGAATTEAAAYQGKQVYVVGGGNSAGQGAMYLSRFAQRVHLVIRRPSLAETMSQYLIDQIAATANISLLACSEITEVTGQERVEQITLQNADGQRQTQLADAVFVFIGTRPHTDWIQLSLIKNDKGFIETGRALAKYEHFKRDWPLAREPYPLETCIPGIFAAGDVRAEAMNRVASAVGEGAMAISFVHKYLAEV
jgi:thioredoxin reductase (NADPH)